ncbi:transposase [Chromobacterium amazonense]|uniref:REP-associated tyrosine transposase n=1 Tax=Chromobacterium amazonense TaxID=1382803 RepID=UPI0008D9B8A2|nr:transposase [Chromobacterium amazonense]OHX15773.1 transposase [Chromobacterium amazonense]
MARFRRERLAGGCYFFTVVTERRQRILLEPDVRAALREAILAVRRERPFAIDGWVLLPDHLHAIWTLPEGDADYAMRWREIKRRVTRAVGQRYFRAEWQSARRAAKGCGTLWQHRYWEHRIRDEADFAAHLDYAHFNPVKHGLAASAAAWPYSTFHRYVQAGRYPADWGGKP